MKMHSEYSRRAIIKQTWVDVAESDSPPWSDVPSEQLARVAVPGAVLMMIFAFLVDYQPVEQALGPWQGLLGTATVITLGATFPAFWILASRAWLYYDTRHYLVES